jgi:hypothetical protein
MQSNPDQQQTSTIPAAEVRKGDTVLGSTTHSAWTGKIEPLYHSNPYIADPQADKPGCGCPGHESLTDEDRTKTLVVLYDGENWDYACDVVPADLLIIIAARPETPEVLPEMDHTSRGWEFTHNGTPVVVYPTPGTPEEWSARLRGGKTIVAMRPTREDAARGAIAILNGDTNGQTGWDILAGLLSL